MAASKVKKSRFIDNTHVSNIMQKLNEQRQSSKFCDVILKVCDTSVPVHSNVLAAASPYFHTFLGQGEDDPRAFSQNTPQMIEIHINGEGNEDNCSEAIKLVIDYMYTGEVAISSAIINQVAQISKIMCLYKLSSFCEWFVKEESKAEKQMDVFYEDTMVDGENVEVTPQSGRLAESFLVDIESPSTSSPLTANSEKDESENSEAFHHSKRKRGRPRKITQTEDENEIYGPKRGRGRPRKITQIEDSHTDEKSLPEKKKINGEVGHSDDETRESFKDTSAEDGGNVTEFSSRSGRKRKLTIKMQYLTNSNDDSLSGLGFVRKRDRYKCAFCPFSTNSIHNHQQHNQAHDRAKRKYMCETCGYTSEKAKSMHVHKKEHLHENYNCDLCEYNGDTKENFENHMKRHDDPLPFFCKYCDHRFRTKTQLNFHYPKHSKLKPFVCKICDAGFKWKHALKNHMVTHSTTKEHLCDVCGFATAHKSQLKAHKLVHTGDTYKCPECNFQATRKQNLKYHMVTHTREKPHQCEVCGQSFSLIKNMKRHMLLHTNERPYKCDQCTFTTTRFDKLKEHLKKQHGQGDDSKKKSKEMAKTSEHSKLHPQASKILTGDLSDVTEVPVTEVVDTDVLSTLQSLQIQVEGSKIVGVPHAQREVLIPTSGDSLQPISLMKFQEDGSEVTYHFVQLETT
ncbi:zinc finger protein 585A-like [Saccostrea echinata]|uniref:zinc finger protein 585A-like n=1 Tax=Saccostrea echinata TaxID=191078 RepID=UPI002A81ACEB|nr:zinc finger protein 585A-like [Saccostrea echinata]